MSFKAHKDLATKHDGDRVWGYRNVYCTDIKLQAQTVAGELVRSEVSLPSPSVPSRLDWLLPESVKSYHEIGTPKNSAQVNPFIFTKTLAKLAEGKGAEIIFGLAKGFIYKDDGKSIDSDVYHKEGASITITATDVVIAAGPWTSKLFPSIHLGAPHGHSVVVRPSRNLSPYVLFPKIEPPVDGNLQSILSPEICPRPGDGLHSFDTVYACGPDDYTVPLPETTERVEVDKKKCEDVWLAVNSVSREIHDGEVITEQACYKPQIRPHEEDEEIGPIVGSVGIKGLWLATGHDEWGVSNSAGTGLVMSEMILEGKAKSADCESLDPKHFLQ